MTAPLTAALADRYRIERELGKGGMATVYLAHDLKHDRKVAIKVLRPELAAVIGAERFLREIKTIAHLQHPHILGLIDSGEVNGTAYYVMPFVEGESLRDRLNHEKQLSIRDAVRIATEVAGALDYAHRHGVVHRDIKPENVMLHDGSALVTDFGIALAVSSAGGSRMTETGMSLGTPHYMSPEQAMGEREITARSDIYALGVVTYEMLVGEPPFGGATAQAIVARVLTEEPRSLVGQRRSIPPEVESAVFTSLEKLPADRFDSAAEFALALGGPADGRARRHVPPSRRSAVSSLGRPALIVGALAIAGAAFFLGTRTSGGRDVPLMFGKAAKVTWDPELEVMPAISPDGKSVAYASGNILMTRVLVRPVSGGRSIALTDDTTDIQSHPRWSPDGSRVLFLSRGGVWSAPASGGPARPEMPATRFGPVVTADWSPDGRSIAYLAGDSLYVRDERSQSRSLAGLLDSHDCRWSPRGDLIACTSGNALSLQIGVLFGNISPSTVVLVGVSDGRVQAITDSTSLNQSPTWSPDGRVLYFISNRHGPRDIYAQRLSGNRLDGAPLRLTTGLNAQTIALAATGRQLVYTSLQSESNAWSIAIPARLPATEDDAVQLTEGAQVIESASLSPDGQWLLYDSDLGGNMDLYRKRLPDGVPERLTTDSADDFFPDLSPDGRETAFHSWRGGSRDIYVMPMDGGPIQQITSTPAQESSPRWSPDGQALVFSPFGVGRGGIWVVRRKDGRWQTPIQRLHWGFQATWSPDGKRLVFGSTLLAGSMWIMPADSGAPRLLADTVGPNAVIGELPSWSEDGRTIYLRSRARDRWVIWAVPLDGRPPQHAVEFDRRNGSTIRGSWNFRRGKFVYSAEDLRSDVWVMEVSPLPVR